MKTLWICVPPHASVAELPEEMLAGLTVSVHAGAVPPPPVMTVTAAVQVAVCPVGLVAVPVNVVLAFTEREFMEPPTAGDTEPTPWSMEKVSTLVAVHDSDVNDPAATEVGFAESVQVGAVGEYVHEPSSTVADAL